MSDFLKNFENSDKSQIQLMHVAISQSLASKGEVFGKFSNTQNNKASLESLSEEVKTNINRDVDEIISVIDSSRDEIANNERVFSGENPEDNIPEFNSSQQKAAIGAAIATADPAFIRRSMANNTPASSENVIVIGPESQLSGEIATSRFGLEAYDESSPIRDVMTNSITYNLYASRQDEFGEAFFPTITTSPDKAGVSIVVRLITVIHNNKRAQDGSYHKFFNGENIIRGLIDPTILDRDTTRCYPVYRDEPKIKEFFVNSADIAPKTIVLENEETVKTAPLAIGKRINDYIALSAIDSMLSAGVMDSTDQLDPAVKLSALYVKIAGEVFAYTNLDMIPEATFTASPAGNSRQLLLNFRSDSLTINKDSRLANGSESSKFATLISSGININFSVAVNGNINVNTGEINTSATGVEVYRAYDSTGNQILPGETGISDLFKGAEVIGFDIIARRINKNRRERGQIIDENTETLVYTIPVLSPYACLRSTLENGGDDASCIDRLVKATFIRSSNAAVATLLNVEDYLQQLPKNFEESEIYSAQVLGAARYYLTPWYKKTILNVEKEINSIKSSERVADIQAVITNAIRFMVYSAYMESGYQAASDVIYGPNAKKPVVIIGTDPLIANYIFSQGDWRTLGNQFDVKVVSTLNLRMRNKILIAFGKNGTAPSDTTNPLHFGNMFWRPEATSILNVSRNNTTNKELVVQPSFLHVVNTPVLGSIEVTNLPTAAKESVPLAIKDITSKDKDSKN